MKEIHFYIDTKEETISDDIITDILITYDSTKEALEEGRDIIRTTQITFLSFTRIEEGYDIYVHCNGRVKKMYPGMDSYGQKDIRLAHNLCRLLTGGYFNKDFDYEF